MPIPYVYFSKDAAPAGPYGTGPRRSSCVLSYDSVAAIWPAIRKWKLDIIDCNFTLSAYVYNATQRGTYYYQYDGSGTMTTPAIKDICADGEDSRVFDCPECVTASYKYIPCGNMGEDCGGGPGTFCNSREAMAMLSMRVTMNSWVVDISAQGGSGNSSPICYWDIPFAHVIGDGGNSTGGIPFTSCFVTPFGANTGYGCNPQGYDCFGGPGGPAGGPAKQSTGYWQLNGEVWTYSADWYWVNVPPLYPWTCGKCTYCKPVCECGKNCSSGKSCGENHDQCGAYPCGDHDLWQKGHISLTLSPGTTDPNRCTT
jgi:hypothetical protein